MLKYLPKDTLAQWAVGSIAVAGAASVAYIVVFPPDRSDPAPGAPHLGAITEPFIADGPDAEHEPDMRVAMTEQMNDAAPRFDLVRVTDIGDVLIAGKAPAISIVAALVDEAQVAQTVSSAAGEFVMMFDLQPSPAPRVLELEVHLPSGHRVRSEDTLMLAPRSEQLAGQRDTNGSTFPVQTVREVETAPLFPDRAAPPRPQPGDATDVTDMPSEPDIAGNDAMPPAEEPTAQAEAAPMAILMRADGSVQVLGEAARLPQAESAGNVVVDSVLYDAEGDVALGGRSASAGTEIQIYLDNQPIIRTRAGADGNWQALLAGIERGVYRLRVDELDEAAQVISRAEIPFERVTPQIARESDGPQALIVQPGNTLWAMSEARFGDGRRYMRIFDANRDQIRNPDLIFPGQVFILPTPEG
ncbi:LysM peptidoglycan-binding domain-containing protein [Roseinatronobacter alkalisoli]|uniref:LysM peptidoglycan-binding domain-containing protein n=1 Tax=Roseinatronobacter alkalisoli TaxID=3028235 RepID=A0ABT5T4K8_9RHOB|nr:LysM peptidoglycan-binding domain-containing protein [Roseinatronobacter sp. HJB301]MDD7969921.1 LysM peptidoglycan-binding domain-containing protein [Roseinatronobacter sp. HJB301]